MKTGFIAKIMSAILVDGKQTTIKVYDPSAGSGTPLMSIAHAFKTKKPIDDFSVVPDYDEIREKNYAFSTGQYFDVTIEYGDITVKEFKQKMDGYKNTLAEYFKQGRKLETEIQKHPGSLQYGK